MKRIFLILQSQQIFVFIVLVTVLFVLSVPRVKAIFPWHYTQSSQQFLAEVTETKNVDPKTFWHFREFYSPGSFSFDPAVVTFGETQIISAIPHDRNVLLRFTSPRLESTDFIVKTDPSLLPSITLTGIFAEYDTQHTNDQVVFQNETIRIWQTQDGKYLLIFVKSIDEMKTANGFFNYIDSEKRLLENTVWLNVTTFW